MTVTSNRKQNGSGDAKLGIERGLEEKIEKE